MSRSEMLFSYSDTRIRARPFSAPALCSLGKSGHCAVPESDAAVKAKGAQAQFSLSG